MPKILEESDYTNIPQIIEQEMPGFKVETCNLITLGWDSVVADVNDNYIFRFPRSKNYPLERENRVLDYLKDKISARIPIVEFVGSKFLFMGYRKIQGISLEQDLALRFTEVQRSYIAPLIAQFLYELHSGFSVDFGTEIGLRTTTIKSYVKEASFENAEHIQNKKLRDFVLRIIERYLALPKDESNIVVIHGDMHGRNMVVQKDNEHILEGIIDFGDIEIGDAHLEFCPMYNYLRPIVHQVIQKYNEFTGNEISIERVATYSRIIEVSELCSYMHDPQSRHYPKAKYNLERWMNEELL